MCGICGVISDRIDRDELIRARDKMIHRGPDASGIFIDKNVGLAHRRLSIIDVAGGAQPLSNEDGSVWITYNGEIYNYAELMDQLRARGHTFRTRSDTEVLVHLYEERGEDLVQALNGMFAFAIHDSRRKRVLLARDHFGIKPLYYAVHEGVLYFGSEIKTVLAGMGRPASTTTDAVHEYLMFRCCTGDRSFFEGVHRLPPGSVA